jgi:hypothetical protein
MTAIESTQTGFISELIQTDDHRWKNICPYSTLFVCIKFQVDKQIAVRLSDCVFYEKFTAVSGGRQMFATCMTSHGFLNKIK